jgi:hypothetical protein
MAASVYIDTTRLSDPNYTTSQDVTVQVRCQSLGVDGARNSSKRLTGPVTDCPVGLIRSLWSGSAELREALELVGEHPDPGDSAGVVECEDVDTQPGHGTAAGLDLAQRRRPSADVTGRVPEGDRELVRPGQLIDDLDAVVGERDVQGPGRATSGRAR